MMKFSTTEDLLRSFVAGSCWIGIPQRAQFLEILRVGTKSPSVGKESVWIVCDRIITGADDCPQKSIKGLLEAIPFYFDDSDKAAYQTQKTYQQEYRLQHRVAINQYSKQYYLDHRTTVLTQNKEWGKLHKHEKARTARCRYHLNLETSREIARESRRKRKLRDPIFKLTDNLRSRLNSALKTKNWKKNTHFSAYIGCTLLELQIYIQNQFQPGMTWTNHTRNGWHVDHIVPLASASAPRELYRLCHYTNLQPLWALDNLQKGKKEV